MVVIRDFLVCVMEGVKNRHSLLVMSTTLNIKNRIKNMKNG